MEIITESTATAIINVAIEKIDLTTWLFTLKDEEYQACSSAHIACGVSTTREGKRLSINVENIAGNLLVQHYVEDINERDHCRVNSISDSISAMGKTKLGITWELKLNKLTDTTCALTNHVIVFFTEEFLDLLKKVGIIDINLVKNSMEQNVTIHNNEETPLFAKDMEVKALAGMWLFDQSGV